MSKVRAARISVIAAVLLAVVGAFASPARAATGKGQVARPAATAAAATTWQFRKQINLTDRCGGAKGWVQWTNPVISSPEIQMYGLVWENPISCGGSGVHYIKFTWDDPLGDGWSSASVGQTAGPGKTTGFNSGVILIPTDFNIGHIVGYLCSTEGTGNCNSTQHF